MSTTIVVHDMAAASAERNDGAVHVTVTTTTGDRVTIVAKNGAQADTGAKAWLAAFVMFADPGEEPPPLDLEGGAS